MLLPTVRLMDNVWAAVVLVFAVAVVSNWTSESSAKPTPALMASARIEINTTSERVFPPPFVTESGSILRAVIAFLITTSINSGAAIPAAFSETHWTEKCVADSVAPSGNSPGKPTPWIRQIPPHGHQRPAQEDFCMNDRPLNRVPATMTFHPGNPA
ncbi:MAG: hypothetical protein ACC645_14140, partial [Pirellulales bacterium]